MRQAVTERAARPAPVAVVVAAEAGTATAPEGTPAEAGVQVEPGGCRRRSAGPVGPEAARALESLSQIQR